MPHNHRVLFGPASLCALSLGALVALGLPARASVPEGLLAAGAQYSPPLEARVFGLAEMELYDYLGLRLEAAVATRHKKFSGGAWAGPTLSLDITSWAPTLFYGVGWRSAPNTLAMTLRVELRRYVSLHGAIGGGIGAEWGMPAHWQISAMLGYFYRL